MFDQVAGLMEFLPLVVTPLIFWVRSLMAKVDQLESSLGGLKRVLEDIEEKSHREHSGVSKDISSLSHVLTTEVRGIVSQHNEHDKQNTRLEAKIDQIVRVLEK